MGNLEDTPRVTLFDKVLKNIGYILTKRTRGQSLQESYVNQALLKELVENNNLTILFQNELRLRGGRFNQPVISDMSITWLLQNYFTALSKDVNVHLVPVSINSERLFEISNLTTEMVSGEVPRVGMRHIIKKLHNFQKGALGKTYVYFGSPFTVNDFLKSMDIRSLNVDNFEYAGLKLTTKLMKNQQRQ